MGPSSPVTTVNRRARTRWTRVSSSSHSSSKWKSTANHPLVKTAPSINHHKPSLSRRIRNSISPSTQLLTINRKTSDEDVTRQTRKPTWAPTSLPTEGKNDYSRNSIPFLRMYTKSTFPRRFSISPSATNSRFSTPGARSLPLTPPSVPFSIHTPPAAALSCPDGLAHALSEQNLRLQQIVYENRVRIPTCSIPVITASN